MAFILNYLCPDLEKKNIAVAVFFFSRCGRQVGGGCRHIALLRDYPPWRVHLVVKDIGEGAPMSFISRCGWDPPREGTPCGERYRGRGPCVFYLKVWVGRGPPLLSRGLGGTPCDKRQSRSCGFYLKGWRLTSPPFYKGGWGVTAIRQFLLARPLGKSRPPPCGGGCGSGYCCSFWCCRIFNSIALTVKSINGTA